MLTSTRRILWTCQHMPDSRHDSDSPTCFGWVQTTLCMLFEAMSLDKSTREHSSFVLKIALLGWSLGARLAFLLAMHLNVFGVAIMPVVLSSDPRHCLPASGVTTGSSTS
eukprot:TRINITY_DN65858_c0_g1_i1.p3 TRINITY_DN65858_c0_g1~~TRINITY_DN65858_c0_g1_i1.p3  ORF type:complete len:110 (-),score=10.26 TRINITY_DN65858_c0_g1_i1:303-632(-)